MCDTNAVEFIATVILIVVLLPLGVACAVGLYQFIFSKHD